MATPNKANVKDATKTCPRCGESVTDVLKIDTGMKLRLQDAGVTDALPEVVCQKCFTQLGVQLNQGAKLRAEQHMRDQNRMILWRNRVNLIKQAKVNMERRAFSEAAVLYEKYLRVIEIVYELQPGKLSPDIFSSAARAKELTVISSVYWDLFRIYDSSARYGERQKTAAEKLALFIPRSMVGEEILEQAAIFQKTAKNPKVVEDLLKRAKYKKTKCFIATAAFEGRMTWEVETLYLFRDRILARNFMGRMLTNIYYQLSPPLANWIQCSPRRQSLVRRVLTLIAARLLKTFNLQRPSDF